MTETNDAVDTLRRAIDAVQLVADEASAHLYPTWVSGRIVATHQRCICTQPDPDGEAVHVATIRPPRSVSLDEVDALANHIALWCPAAALDVVGALADMVNLHEPAPAPNAHLCAICGEAGQGIAAAFPCDTLRLLAQGVTPLLRAGMQISAVHLRGGAQPPS